MTGMEKELKKYHQMNSIAKSNCVVLFGSDTFSSIPASELSEGFEIVNPVYNRSLVGIGIEECEKALNECIYELEPAKIFLNIGENDIKKEDFKYEDFISKYEWLLYTVHSHCKCRIYVVSLLNDSPKTALVNEKLRQISENTGCCFIDISSAKNSPQLELKIFEILRCRLRCRSISMIEAFGVAN